MVTITRNGIIQTIPYLENVPLSKWLGSYKPFIYNKTNPTYGTYDHRGYEQLLTYLSNIIWSMELVYIIPTYLPVTTYHQKIQAFMDRYSKSTGCRPPMGIHPVMGIPILPGRSWVSLALALLPRCEKKYFKGTKRWLGDSPLQSVAIKPEHSLFWEIQSWKSVARWWQLKDFLEFSTSNVGEDEPIFDEHIFSNGLVQPPTRTVSITYLL